MPDVAPEDKVYRLYDGSKGTYEQALREVLAHWRGKKAEAESRITDTIEKLHRIGAMVEDA
jgi:hypothetical protein